MHDLIQRAIDTATARGAYYADARVVRRQVERLVVRNGRLDAATADDTLGIGVRVLVDGAWGFSSTDQLSGDGIDAAAAEAVAIARASALVRQRVVDLGPPVRSRGTWATPVEQDPFLVPLEERLAILVRSCEAMMAVRRIAAAEAGLELVRERKWFGNSEGAATTQEIIETGCGIEATAVGDGEVQNRSYPNSVGRQQQTRGWEMVLGYDLPGNAGRIAEEAVALLTAPQCPPGITTVILDGSQTALQVHESCGHPIELDRVLGSEAAFAGTSFLDVAKLGAFTYGSPAVTIVADATVPGGLGTFGWDDEGVPAQRTMIVDQGRFTGYLTSRETAALLGQVSNGTMRADSWNRIPLIRMTNIDLQPGTWDLPDLIADTDEGIYMQTNRSWSIDDRRLNFQFGTEIAWEIRGGKLGRMLRNPTYTGSTPGFWAGCDAVCNARWWDHWGTPNCGKGQPEQVAHVGHGAAPARFRHVRVGVMA